MVFIRVCAPHNGLWLKSLFLQKMKYLIKSILKTLQNATSSSIEVPHTGPRHFPTFPNISQHFPTLPTSPVGRKMLGSSVGGLLEIDQINKIKVQQYQILGCKTKTTAFVRKIFILGHLELNYANYSKKSLILGIWGILGQKSILTGLKRKNLQKISKTTKQGSRKKKSIRI